MRLRVWRLRAGVFCGTPQIRHNQWVGGRQPRIGEAMDADARDKLIDLSTRYGDLLTPARAATRPG